MHLKPMQRESWLQLQRHRIKASNSTNRIPLFSVLPLIVVTTGHLIFGLDKRTDLNLIDGAYSRRCFLLRMAAIPSRVV